MDLDPNVKKPVQQGDYDMAADADPARMEHYMQGMRDQQNLMMAVLGGLVAAVLGAGAWALVTVIGNREYGLMAVAVGFLVGMGVRYLGKGVDKNFGVIGAFFSLLGILTGKVLVLVVLLGKKLDVPIKQVLSILNMEMITSWLKETFSVIDIAIYAIALAVGYKYSFKSIPPQDLLKMKK